MKGATGLQVRAKRRHAEQLRLRQDARYIRVVGRYVAASVLTTTADIEPYREPIEVADALWAGELEPRILELLPALIAKRPAMFVSIKKLPADLAAAVFALRKNQAPSDFRGIPGATLLRWLPSVGRSGKVPSRLKCFRLQHDDLELLEKLSHKLGLSQTAILRRGLREVAARELL